MKKRSARALLCLLLAAAGAANAADMPEDVPLFPYENQGQFVILPARIASALVYQTGFMVGTIVCLPASLIQDAKGEEDIPRDKEASVVCGRTLGIGLGWPVYAAAGLPFYLLKGIFWTGPRAAAALFHKAAAPEPAP